MARHKWLILILIVSLLLNIWLGVQYKSFRQLSNQTNQTAEYITNMTLSHIREIIALTTEPKVDWESIAFNLRLANEIKNVERAAWSVAPLEYIHDPNLADIRQELSNFAMIIGNISMQTESLGNEMPLTEKDKDILKELGKNLKDAGFSTQVQEDNGEDFRNSLEKFSMME